MASTFGLGTLLRMVTARLDGDIQALYDELDTPFRPRFFPIVQQLLRDGPTTIGALARTTGVTQPAATQTVREMAKLGLLELKSGDDLRERLASLTPAGLQLAEQLRHWWDAIAEAAQELDQELPCPLSQTLSITLDALAREPFSNRIRRKIKDA